MSLLTKEDAKSSEAILTELETALERAIGTTWEGAKMMEDFDPSSSDAFLNIINDFSENLRDIEEAGKNCDKMMLHRNVINKVDNGINPDLFMQEYAQIGKQHNELMRAKLFSTKVLHNHLQARLDDWDEHMKNENEDIKESEQASSS